MKNDETPQMKPTVYLDKGALSCSNLAPWPEAGRACYSEALLLDLKNDKSQTYKQELDWLNSSKALFMSHEGNAVTCSISDSHAQFEKVDRFEAKYMASIYGFMCGGGPSATLLGVFKEQQTELASFDPMLGVMFGNIADNNFCPADWHLMQSQETAKWKSQLQRATRDWSQDPGATLQSIFDKNPDVADELKGVFPEKPENFEQIHLAALMLGVLHLGQDKGIKSTNPQKSQSSAENGYIDCLHIAYALHCDVFLTTDQATHRRFKILNEYWKLGKHGGLIAKSAPKGAFLY